MTVTKSSSMSGHEADPAGLLSADLDVGQRGGGHDVDLALVVTQLHELRVGIERLGDDLLDVSGGLRRLEADLTGAVGDTDANVHETQATTELEWLVAPFSVSARHYVGRVTITGFRAPATPPS